MKKVFLLCSVFALRSSCSSDDISNDFEPNDSKVIRLPKGYKVSQIGAVGRYAYFYYVLEPMDSDYIPTIRIYKEEFKRPITLIETK